MHTYAPLRRRGGRTGLAVVILCGLSSTALEPATAGEFKCWQGSDGEMQCGEVMPPEQRNVPTTTYDRHGRRVSTGIPVPEDPAPRVEPETPGKPEKHPESPSEADRVFLLHYPTLAELTAARDHELVAIDTLIQTEQMNVRGQEAVLDRLRTQAADLERAGRPLARELLDKIDQADRAIQQRRAAAEQRTLEKQAILRAYELKLARFRVLKGIPDTASVPMGAPGRGPAGGTGSAPDALAGSAPAVDAAATTPAGLPAPASATPPP